jgi:hypothetical protein
MEATATCAWLQPTYRSSPVAVFFGLRNWTFKHYMHICMQVGVMRACEWRVGSWAVGRDIFLLEWSFKVCVRVSVSDAMGLGDVGQCWR